MGVVAAGQFSCDGCGKTYRWKPELAGRKARCKCGSVMVCPKDEPGKEDDDGLFELAPDVQEKPARPAAIVSPLQPPLAPATGTIAYQSKQSQSEESNQLMDLWAPVFLILGAIAGQALAAFIRTRGNPASLTNAMTAVGVDMIFGTLFMMIGMWLAAKSRHIQLGAFATALLKLCAIAVAPGAAIELLSIPLRVIPLFGWLIAWVVGFMLYFALIGTLFDLDQDDTWYCVKVIFAVKILTAVALIWGLAALMHTAG